MQQSVINTTHVLFSEMQSYLQLAVHHINHSVATIYYIFKSVVPELHLTPQNKPPQLSPPLRNSLPLVSSRFSAEQL